MSKKMLSCIVFSLVILLSSIGQAANANDDFRRSSTKYLWLESASEAVQRMNDAEANKIFAFIKANIILGKPHQKSLQLMEKVKSDNWIVFVPLLEKDGLESAEWMDISSASAAANFLPEIRALIIKDVPFSSIGKAIVFLHENYHAYVFANNPYEEQNIREYCEEEMKSHEFQNRITNLLGGEKYQTILKKEVGRIADGYDETETIPTRTTYDEMATALTKPASRLEDDFIQTSFWIHAAFSFLEERFPREATEKKLCFLFSVYQTGGIL